MRGTECLSKQTEQMLSPRGYRAVGLIISISEQENWSIKGKGGFQSKQWGEKQKPKSCRQCSCWELMKVPQKKLDSYWKPRGLSSLPSSWSEGMRWGKKKQERFFRSLENWCFSFWGRGGAELCCPSKEFPPKPSVLRGQEMLGVSSDHDGHSIVQPKREIFQRTLECGPRRYSVYTGRLMNTSLST